MRKIRWGVLGTAGIARWATIPGMRKAENCQLYAIAGRSLEKAKQFQQDFGFEKAYGSYEELLNDPQVEAVYIPLPNDLHAPWSIRAMEAGKHVLCEKPLAGSEAEARRMFGAADRCGVHLMEAFAYLHNPFMDAVKQELDAGAVGDICYFESAFIGGRTPDTDIRMYKEKYGGALYDLGCYAASMTLWMMGEPQDVRASAQFSDRGVDLFTSAVLTYANGAFASLDCGMALPNARVDRFRVHGTRGSIVSDVRFNQSGEIAYTVTHDGEAQVKTVFARDNYTLEVEQLGRCILGEEKPRVTREFSLMTARLLDRILKEIGY